MIKNKTFMCLTLLLDSRGTFLCDHVAGYIKQCVCKQTELKLKEDADVHKID